MKKWKKLNTSHPELQNQLLTPIKRVQFSLCNKGFPWLNILKFFTQYCWQLLCFRSPYSGGGLTQIKGVSVLSDFANNIGKVKLIFQAPIAWNINFTCLVKLILQALVSAIRNWRSMMNNINQQTVNPDIALGVCNIKFSEGEFKGIAACTAIPRNSPWEYKPEQIWKYMSKYSITDNNVLLIMYFYSK